jgi:hypothetical protein
VHICNPSTQETHQKDLEFECDLGYIAALSQKKKSKKERKKNVHGVQPISRTLLILQN